jgi:CO/xanthine dehydrogenase FAD-binding subunit
VISKNSSKYVAPDSIEAALKYLLTEKNVFFLAGGTELLPQIKHGLKQPSLLVDLGKIGSLKGMNTREEGLFIGAMETLGNLVKNSQVNRYIPILGHSALRVASPQIRNRATLVGNILQERRCLYFNQSEYWRQGVVPCFKLGGEVCHQIPRSRTCCALYYSDTAPVLLALDAQVEQYDRGTIKVTSLQDIILSHIHGDSEKRFLTGILIPYPGLGTWARFIKQCARAAIDFPSLNAAVRYTPPVNGRRPVVRIFVGASSPEPLELKETADFMIANLSHLSELEEEVKERAVKELKAKSSLVRETGISLNSKKSSYYLISNILEELFTALNSERLVLE